MLKRILMTLGLVQLLMLSGHSLAACAINNPLDCVRDPGSIGSGEALGHYEFNIQNSCGEPIWAAVHYLDMDHPNCPHMTTDPCECGGCWKTNGYWEIQPGQTLYVGSTTNRIIYFHANTANNAQFWGDSDHTWPLYDKSVPFSEVTLPNSFTRWTQNLTCN